MRLEAVSGWPATEITSLKPTGIPSRGRLRASPPAALALARRSSEARACASASVSSKELNARIRPSTCFVREMTAPMSSAAESAPLSISRDSSEIVEKQRSSDTAWGARLFDHPGHDEHGAPPRGRVAQRVLDGEPRLRHVGLPDVDDGERVGRGLDPGYVHLAQLRHVGEHVAELRREARLLLLREVEAGEVRDVVELEVLGFWHGSTS